MLTKAIPVLPTVDIIKTIHFFEAKLGFRVTNYGNYAVMNDKNTEIHLFVNTDKNPNAGCLIMVENIEDLYTGFCTEELIDLKGKLTDKPWGNKEFTLTDNHTHIRFGEKRSTK